MHELLARYSNTIQMNYCYVINGNYASTSPIPVERHGWSWLFVSDCRSELGEMYLIQVVFVLKTIRSEFLKWRNEACLNITVNIIPFISALYTVNNFKWNLDCSKCLEDSSLIKWIRCTSTVRSLSTIGCLSLVALCIGSLQKFWLKYIVICNCDNFHETPLVNRKIIIAFLRRAQYIILGFLCYSVGIPVELISPTSSFSEPFWM